MPTSSKTIRVFSSKATRPWSSRQMRLARVRDSAVPASVPRLRAAWPEVAAPSTWWPERSKASATARSMVVLPAPATPTVSSAPRPEVQMPTHGGALLVRQPGTDGLLGAGDGAVNGFGGGGGPVGAGQLAGQALGDGALPGQHRSQRMGPFPRPGHADQGDDLGAAKARSANRSSTSGRWPKTCGARATTRWRREKTLRRARSPSGPSTSETSARTPLALSGWTASRS